MSCSQLRVDRPYRCDAVAGEIVPSLRERERYCLKDGGCAACPTFSAYKVCGMAIEPGAYYAIWAPLDEDVRAAS